VTYPHKGYLIAHLASRSASRCCNAINHCPLDCFEGRRRNSSSWPGCCYSFAWL